MLRRFDSVGITKYVVCNCSCELF